MLLNPIKGKDFYLNFLILHLMKKLSGNILYMILLLLTTMDAYGQEKKFDRLLDRYESLCGECMDMKARAASGASVSRDEARSLIDAFLDMNRVLKADEKNMTVLERRRFAAIGTWFSGGTPPEPEPYWVPSVQSLPVARPVNLVQVADSSSYAPRLVPSAFRSEFRPRQFNRVYLLASVTAPDMAYGIMAGFRVHSVGGYVSFRSNYIFESADYSCDSEGNIEGGGRIWRSGQKLTSNLQASAGMVMRTFRHMDIYAGIGYGFRQLAWEDVSGDWALVSDWSHKGFAAECGVLMSWRKLVFSAGVSTVAFRTASFTLGVGVRL